MRQALLDGPDIDADDRRCALGSARRCRASDAGRRPRPGHDRRRHGAELSVLALRPARAARARRPPGGAVGHRGDHGRDRAARLDDAARRRCASSAVDVVVLGECEEVLVAAARGRARIRADCRAASPIATARSSSRAARRPRLGRSAGTALARRVTSRASHAIIITASTRAPAAPGRGDGDFARLPLSLHLLRQG